MTPWLDDGDVQLYHGDAASVLASLPEGSAQTCVTSPPYWGLRDYGTSAWVGSNDPSCDHADAPTQGEPIGPVCPRCGAIRVDRQLGLEQSPDLYVERLVGVFREVRRVLRDDGTLWLNLGDTYAAKTRGTDAGWDKSRLTNPATVQKAQAASLRRTGERHRGRGAGLKEKDLAGIPWRVAFALQEDGWYLRSDIVWSKPNPMPESVTDRPTKAHEYVFLLSKQPRYYYDADAIRETAEYGYSASSGNDWRQGNGDATRDPARGRRTVTPGAGGTRNARSVWEIATQPTPEAHFATYPEALVRRCIQAGTSEAGECSACGAPWRRVVTSRSIERPDLPHDHPEWRPSRYTGAYETHVHGGNGGMRFHESTTLGWEASCTCSAPPRPQQVLDPFMGSGTTARVARKHGRRAVGIDLSEPYLEIAAGRLGQQSLMAAAQ